MGIILLDWARQSSPLTSPRHSSQITDNLKSHLWSWNMNCAYKGKWGLLRRTQIWGGVKGFSCGSDGKQAACNAGDPSSIPQSGRSSGEGNGNALQYSCLEKSTTEEPGGLQSMGLKRVGHDWVTNTFISMTLPLHPGSYSYFPDLFNGFIIVSLPPASVYSQTTLKNFIKLMVCFLIPRLEWLLIVFSTKPKISGLIFKTLQKTSLEDMCSIHTSFIRVQFPCFSQTSSSPGLPMP